MLGIWRRDLRVVRQGALLWWADPATGVLLADKGYDTDTLLDWLKERSITAVTPPKANRKMQRDCDWYLYKERHVVELPLILRKKPAMSKKCWPLLQYCCGCADTSTKPSIELKKFHHNKQILF